MTLVAFQGLASCDDAPRSSDDDDDGSSAGNGGSGGGTVPTCGDGVCGADENCQNCGEDCASYGSAPADTTLDQEEEIFLATINDYRMQNGVGPLAGCRSLHRTAQGHSEDMRDNDYFEHIGLNGSEPWDRACDACFESGCGPMTAMGENIAAGNADAAATFEQWRNSPGHNENMLNGSFRFLGIGRAQGGGEFGVYWTNVFAGDDEQSCY